MGRISSFAEPVCDEILFPSYILYWGLYKGLFHHSSGISHIGNHWTVQSAHHNSSWKFPFRSDNIFIGGPRYSCQLLCFNLSFVRQDLSMLLRLVSWQYSCFGFPVAVIIGMHRRVWLGFLLLRWVERQSCITGPTPNWNGMLDFPLTRYIILDRLLYFPVLVS